MRTIRSVAAATSRVARHAAPPVGTGTLAAALLLAAAPAAAEVLPIVNPGFEDVSAPLAVGAVTNGAGGVDVPVAVRPDMFSPADFDVTVEVAGWRTFLPPPNNPTATILAGVMNPPEYSPGVPFLNGYSGVNVATLQISPMQQTLPVQIQPNTHYRLSFLAGVGRGDLPYIVAAGLVAAPDLNTPVFYGVGGSTVLAATQGLITPADADGQMLPYTLEVTTPETLPPEFRSQYIAIGLIGSDGIPRMNYDDFRLEATPVPEPAARAALLLAGLALPRRR